MQNKEQGNDIINLLHSRANMLTGKDKVLVKMFLENGTSYRQMARLTGTNHTTISRRMQRIINRLIDSKYINCRQYRAKFNATEMAIAREYFLLGLPMRKIASKRRWTYYHVRKVIKKFDRLGELCERDNRESININMDSSDGL